MVQLMPLHPKTPSSLASFESRLVLPFWYRLTQVALENRPLNGCSSSRIEATCCLSGDAVSAAGHLSASVSATEVIYGASSIELAHELLKYAEVCATSAPVAMAGAAGSAARRARTLFQLNYGPDCDAVHELNQLLDKLTV